MTLKQDGTISHSMESTGNNGRVRNVKKVERNISYITALQNVSDLRERERRYTFVCYVSFSCSLPSTPFELYLYSGSEWP